MFKRLSVVVLLLLFSPWVWAEDYYWVLNGNNENKFSSVHAARLYRISQMHPDAHVVNSELIKSSDTLFYIQVYYTWGSGTGVNSGSSYVNRYGDGCPEGKTYNAEKGECQFQQTPEHCAAIDGQTFYTYSIPSNALSFCHKGCSASYVLGICGNGACSFNSVYTGGVCEDGQDDIYSPADDNPPTNDNDDNDNPPDPNHPDPDHCPPGYYYGGTQCHKIEAPNDGCPEGQVKQGDNGHCVTPDPNNPPNNEGSDNGGDNNGGGNGDGNNGGGNGSGGGGGGGGGGGKGNGNNDCKEGEDCSGSKVGGESCDVDLTCEGDAIQCAILKQQKKQACLLENDHEHHGQMVSDNEAQEAADKEAFEENSSELPIGNLFNDAKNQSGWLPKSCPAPRTASIAGRTMSFDFSPFCQFATGISPIIVLMASLFFLITVGRAVKG